MKLPKDKLKTAIMLLVLIAVPIAVISNSSSDEENTTEQVQAQENESQATPQESEAEHADDHEHKEGEEHEETAQEAASTYEYVAQPGDSYSKIARKAIQTYGITTETNLSEAQIIFAETKLTQEAGSPAINEGQEIAIDEAKVKNWVDQAKELSDTKQTAWAAYTVGVDFNTDAVGESR